MKIRSLISTMSLATTLALASTASAADLKMVSIDLEGGASTIFLTPEGQSLLIDAGSAPGPATPYSTLDDSERIAAAAKKLGITRFNYFLTSHYHGDHIGGIEAIRKRIPIDTFIDHGETRETTPAAATTYANYNKAIAGAKHQVVKAGDTVKIGSLTLDIVASDGVTLKTPLAGAGKANAACAGSADNDEYLKFGEENARSVGVRFSYGVTKILSLGDLTWNKERELYCPADKVGPVDVLLTTHHGIISFFGARLSNSPFAMGAQDPVVVIMGNGSVKGGGPGIAEAFKKNPNMKGIWPNHQTKEDPATGELLEYTANLLGGADGHATSVVVSDAGVITVTNERNNFSKTYAARGKK